MKTVRQENVLEQVVSLLFKYKPSLFSKSEFGFATRPSIFLIVLLLAGLGALIYFVYFARPLKLTPVWRGTLVGLRVLLIVLIFFCLMRPVAVVPSVIAQSSYVAVLMDDSGSMSLSG